MPKFIAIVENRWGDRGDLPSGYITAKDQAEAELIAKRKARSLTVVEVKQVDLDFTMRPGDFVIQ